MDPLQVTLFGRFCAQRGGQVLDDYSSQKVQELFCYLLLHRDRPHPREMLGSVLWAYCSTERSKAYLRRVLWQLQQALTASIDEQASDVLLVDKDWVQLNPDAPLWLDVGTFEAAYDAVRGVAGRHIDHRNIQALQAAVELYTSDLLENWYHDWCLFERERLQNVYLALLDKLLDYCEAHREYELGLDYGERILRIDRAREHTHRRLMQLRYLAGDRTGALRQFERCEAVLEEELHVQPSRSTQLLCEQMRAGEEVMAPAQSAWVVPVATPSARSLPDRLDQILSLQRRIALVQGHIQQEIKAIEHALHLREPT